MHVEPSRYESRPEAPLPPGVTREANAGKLTTLDNCTMVQLFVTADIPGTRRSFVITKGPQYPKARDIRPVTKKRIRDLRAGDQVTIDGVLTEVVGLQVYR
jgi:hypothetical protein